MVVSCTIRLRSRSESPKPQLSWIGCGVSESLLLSLTHGFWAGRSKVAFSDPLSRTRTVVACIVDTLFQRWWNHDGVSARIVATSAPVYGDRVAVCDRHHRHPHRPPAAPRPKSASTSPPVPRLKQPRAIDA